MNGFSRICSTKDVLPGSMATFAIKGKQVAVGNIGGEYFAVGDVCPHEQCSLGSNGALDGETIICGCHGASFNAKTGLVMAPPATVDIVTYDVQIDGDDVCIKL